ncbi:MAG: helix-turn-helix domain-containing protein [Enterobacteriaceae bacterium]
MISPSETPQLSALLSQRTTNDTLFPLLHLERLCKGQASQRPANLESLLNALSLITPLLNSLSSVVFFVKDLQARYLLVNLTLARRCGFKSITPLLGRTSAEVFPHKLGNRYLAQDQRVLHQGITIRDQLELHFYHDRKTGWCLTQKLPLYDRREEMIGMVGISHDLQQASANHPAYSKLACVDDYIRQHFERTILLEELTQLSGFSVAQLERYCKRIFHLTPRQMIQKVRLERATELLATSLPITDIALMCGYTDHSAFSRQFKMLTGIPPKAYRAQFTSPEDPKGEP